MMDNVVIGWWTEKGVTVAHMVSMGGKDRKEHWTPPWVAEHFTASDTLQTESVTGVSGELFFHDYLVNCNGAGFILFCEPEHTLKDVDDAKRRLRNDRDVVTLRVIKIDRWKVPA